MFENKPIKSVNEHKTVGGDLSDQEVKDLINSVKWMHRMELREGIFTPGQCERDPAQACSAFNIPNNLEGYKVLEIGAWDGTMAFEMERRGAEVFALDIHDPKKSGFDIARRVFNSKINYYQGSIYQLPFGEVSEMDFIVMYGVYYHLKYPVLGFERASAALKMGGVLYFEGECLMSYAEDLEGNPVDIQDEIDNLNEKNIPVCLNYPGVYKGASNWCVPNVAALKSWVKTAGLEIKDLRFWVDGGKAQRVFGTAVKVREPDMIEHPLR